MEKIWGYFKSLWFGIDRIESGSSGIEKGISKNVVPLKSEYHPNEEFKIHSMLIKSTNALEFVIAYCTILDALRCATILPKSENHRKVEEKLQKKSIQNL